MDAEAKRAELQQVGVLQLGFLDRAAVDLGARAALAVADGEAVRAAVDDAVQARNVGGFQADVAAAGTADDGNVLVEVAVFFAGVAVEQHQGGSLRVEYVVVFACHDGAPSTSGAWPWGEPGSRPR